VKVDYYYGFRPYVSFALEPDNQKLVNDLGWSLYQAGLLDEARRVLERRWRSPVGRSRRFQSPGRESVSCPRSA